MTDINILDCTLRDGGYYNNWIFSDELIQQYLDSLRNSIVSVVEIGFRFPAKSDFLGQNAYSTEFMLRKFRIPKSLEIAVMLNASDIIIDNKVSLSLLESLFPCSRDSSLVSFVRVAARPDSIEQSIKIGYWLQEKGFNVILNIMQIDQVLESPEVLLPLAKSSKIFKTVYFADSLGNILPDQIKEYVSIIRNVWDHSIGFHAHDNLGYAHANCLEAIKSGVSWVDSTFLGMGRGAGNVRTEQLLTSMSNSLDKNLLSIVPILDVIDKYFKPLKDKYNWGDNPYYQLCAKKKLHPSYVQEMLESSSYNHTEIIANIEFLSSLPDRRSHDSSMLHQLDQLLVDSYSCSQNNANDDLVSFLNYKNSHDILVLASGDSLCKYSQEVTEFIVRYKPLVFALNSVCIPLSLIDFTLICHPLRLVSMLSDMEHKNNKIISPEYDFSESLFKTQAQSHYYYNCSIRSDTLYADKKSCILPSLKALPYSLAIASVLRPKNLFFAGLDGTYYASIPRKMQEASDALHKFSELTDSRVISLTPSAYNIEICSIFSYLS